MAAVRRSIAASALLATAAGCGAAAPSGDVVRRDSAGVAIVENRAAASGRDGWRLAVAAARPIDLPPVDGEVRVAAAAVLPGGGFAVADEGGRIAWFDRRGRRTRSVALPENPAVGALYVRPTGALVAWDADRLAVLEVGADGSPGSARAYESSLPRGSVTPLGTFGDGSLLVTVRDASMFDIADEPGRDTVPVFRLGPAGTHARILSIPGPQELTWGVAGGGAVRHEAPFARNVFVTVSGDRVWVADALRTELRGYDTAGRLRSIVRAPVRGDSVHPDDAARWRERLRRFARGYLPAEEVQRREAPLEVPTTWPPFAGLLADARGELWVRAGSAPGSVSRWNVFDAGGSWLGEVRVPPQFQLVAVGDGYAIATEHRAEAGDRPVRVPLVRN